MITRQLRFKTRLADAATGAAAALALVGITLSVAANRVHSWTDLARTVVALGVCVGLATWLTRPSRTGLVSRRRRPSAFHIPPTARTTSRHVTPPSLENDE
jgi:hypothetical protein